MRRGLVTTLLIIAACVVPEYGHAASAPPGLAAPTPTEPCDFAHRMDIVIVNGVWFECSCEALMIGTICDWYEITSPAPGLRRRTKTIKRTRGGWLYAPRVRPVLA